jgi:hypothetical protein
MNLIKLLFNRNKGNDFYYKEELKEDIFALDKFYEPFTLR